ncbi:RloB family protein [Oceanibaculum indicum]|uniref:RloB family protein n=1 Tax=Oceanibaculum indicum TaxID=526216 RepID=UPI000A02CF51|nr:RloB family protein [Oceanibaculum indicum]
MTRKFDLRRDKFKREPRARFIIFCEGALTEPEYFEAIKRLYTGSLIEFRIIKAAGVPMTMAESAIESSADIRNRRKKDSYEAADQIWVVFDRDEHPNFDEAIRLCERKKIKIARSNPCFEVWLLLHFCDFDKPGNRHEIQRHLEKIDKDYKVSGRKTLNCDNIVKNVIVAEKRSAELIRRRENERCPYGVVSTTVHLLTSEIRAASDSSS